MPKAWKLRIPKPKVKVDDIPPKICGIGHDWDSARIQRILRAVHKQPLICLCRDDVEEEQRTLHTRTQPSDGALTIARNKDTGPDHLDTCYFFKERSRDSGKRAYVDNVIQEREDGTLLIRLATTLQPRTAGEPRERPAERNDGRGERSQRAMTQRGFLDLLFELAEQNIWRPAFAGHRDPGAVLHRLQRETQPIRSAKKEIASLVGVCWEYPAPRKPPFSGWAYKAKSGGFRGMVLGQVEHFDAQRIVLSRQAEFQFELHLDDVTAAYVERSFGREMGMLTEPHARVFGLFTCDFRYGKPFPDQSVVGEVVDAALIAAEATSCVPVASRHELRMAMALIAAGRSFRKPLRFDADEDVIVPDFILTDRGSDVAIEVWGRRDQLYIERRQKKEAYYESEYPGRFLGWDAAAGEALPNFGESFLAG